MILTLFAFLVLFSYFYRFGQPVLFACFNTNFGFGAGFKNDSKTVVEKVPTIYYILMLYFNSNAARLPSQMTIG